METICAIIFIGLIGLTSGAGVLPDSVTAAVGGTVMFTTSLDLTQTKFILITWEFGTKNIITSSTSNLTAPEYEGRVTLFISTGSLELSNVAESDVGEYRFSIIPTSGAQMIGTTKLNITEPVSNVTVTVNDTDLVEFNSSVRLSCSASGPSLSFLWLNHSSEVTASDRVHLTDGGSTLTIVSVSRYDQGPFTCKVSNPVSSSTSDPVNLSVSYGPYNLEVIGATLLEAGQTQVLFCSADSVPLANYSWVHKSKTISKGSVLQKSSVVNSDSGKYTCEASNSVTGKKHSKDHYLSVIDQCFVAGVLAGIVIACVVIVAIAVGVGCHFYHNRKNKEKQEE